jgi:chorismate mutase
MNNDTKLFKSKEDAEKLLNDSRETINKIDQEIINLISKRTSLASDIVSAKIFLNREIFDEKREKLIYEKVKKLAIEKNIDEDIILKIFKSLLDLNKIAQKELLENNDSK